MTESRKRLFEIIKAESFRYSETAEFTLASGQKSNYYFDCKMTLLNPEGLTLAGQELYVIAKDIPADAAGGLTLGADPLAMTLSLEAYRNGRVLYPVIVRKEPKGHGTKKYIEGNVSRIKTVIALDDVITTGASTIKAIEHLRAEGLTVTDAIVFVDREENEGKKNIENLGVTVHALFKRSDFHQ
jgi:orotate phosphoribosyltransferase